jgi:hypothetical protein
MRKDYKMKLQKLIVTTALLLSTATHADQKSLNIFNALIAAGAPTGQGMSQSHMLLSNLSCGSNPLTHRMGCELDADSEEDGNLHIKVDGDKADQIIDALEVEWPFDPSGTYQLEIKSISCSAVMPGVADGTAADNTDCTEQD